MIKINGIKKNIKVLFLFSFDSDRKRMSVIVEDEGVIKLYCKVDQFYVIT